MFKNAKVVITSQTSKSENIISKMWKDAGARIVKMSAKKHDDLVAFTSHLPHVIAFALKKTYKNIKKRDPKIGELTTGSFKSMTRVTVSSADMWAAIFTLNSKNINEYLNRFIEKLNIFKRNLNDKEKIKKEILKTQEFL